MAVVMDNHQSHKHADTREVLEDFGCEIINTPPYTSVVNNVEHVWALVKRIFTKKVAAIRENVTEERFE